MQDLIKIINEVQDAFSAIGGAGGVDLPQIAVVGGQSAGKSSVLENFVGKDFLPRGSGIVTRRPLILQLQQSDQEYGEFLHAKGRRFDSFDAIRQEIEDETDRLTGTNKGVSNYPINLRVYSPHVLNLTVIDLPGLTKVAVGDQPVDIEDQIRGMLMEFIMKDNCIILAVSPANADLANSDALKLAKEVDPQGIRTVGVLTKLDLMDAGTDARDILENKVLPLRRGYVGVVNRSQADINGNKDIRAALESERKFFLSSPAYRHMADRMGTKYLQKVLNQQLVNHIRDRLPDLQRQLQGQVDSLEKEVKEYTRLGSVNDNQRNTKALVKMVNSYGQSVEQAIEGGGDAVSLTSLSGGAKIAKVFMERFPYELAKVELDEAELRTEIAYAIKNINGIRVGLFTPEEAFEAIVKKLIEGLKPPCDIACELVTSELRTITHDLSEKLKDYPQLMEEITSLMMQQLSECESAGKAQVAMTIDVELSYINSNHPDFIGFANAASAIKSGNSRGNSSKGNTLLRKGFLQIKEDSKKNQAMNWLKGGKEVFVVVTTNTITFFKDKDEKELRGQVKTEGLKLEDIPDGSKGCTFRIFHPSESLKMYKEQDHAILHAQNKDTKTAWQASLLRAGVYPQKKKKVDGNEEFGANSMDPQLERQVDIIRNLVDSYLGIVTKKLQDTIPKIIMHLVVNAVKEFSKEDLLGGIYSQHGSEADSLLEESQDLITQRKELVNIYESSKKALKAIAKVSAKTRSEPLPPPVQNNIKVEARKPVVPTPTSPRGPPPTAARPAPKPAPSSRPPPAAPKRAPPPSRPAAQMPARPTIPGRPNVPARP